MTKIIYHPFIAIVITIIAVIFFISLDKTAKRTEISSKNIEILENEVSEMAKKTSEIEEQILETDTDEFKERVIRNELLQQKDGEAVVTLSSNNTQENEEKIPEKTEKPIDAWKKILTE